MTNNIIYHRSDLDGFCSGAIARMWLEQTGQQDDIVMIGWDYGDEIPAIANLDVIIMTDISFPAQSMKLLEQRIKDFIWIDHHKSAILDSEKHDYELIDGRRKIGDSASLLAWKYFFPNVEIPEIVYWVDRYDVWKKLHEDGYDDWKTVMQYQYGMRQTLGNPNDDFNFELWKAAFVNDAFMGHILNDGRLLLDYEQRTNKIRCSNAFDLEFEGLKFAVINNTLSGSTVLDSYARPDHDGLMVFGYEPKGWKVSLYQNTLNPKTVDLSLIAVKYGGGGHAGACGFLVNNINDILQWKKEQQ